MKQIKINKQLILEIGGLGFYKPYKHQSIYNLNIEDEKSEPLKHHERMVKKYGDDGSFTNQEVHQASNNAFASSGGSPRIQFKSGNESNGIIKMNEYSPEDISKNADVSNYINP